MRIVLSPMGTAGDIRPFIALGLSLKKLGNEVSMVVPKNGEDLCKKFELSYRTIDFDYRDYVKAVALKPSLKEITILIDRQISAQFEGMKEIPESTDFLIGGAGNYALQSMAELYGIPYYRVWHTVQVFKSSHHAPWRFSRQNNPAWMNRLLWLINNLKENGIGKEFINKHRSNLGLKPLNDFASIMRQNIILSADKLLSPVPSDVNDKYLQTGYWYLFEDGELDSEIIDFIQSGKPPVFFGFGSMADPNGEQTVEMLENILCSLDMRAVVQKGWAGLVHSGRGKRIKVIEHVPHHKIFPMMSAVIHHGGAGTVHTAAWSGVPQIIVPQVADQFFWGEKLHNLMISPSPVQKSKLTADSIKNAIIQAVNNNIYAENAKILSDKLHNGENMDTIAEKLQKEMIIKIEQLKSK